MSIHRLVLTSGLNPVESGLNNGLLCVCSFCQNPVLTFVNQHNSPLTLTNVIIDTASFGGGVAVYLNEINGNPISYPYTVFEGQSIQIEFEVCYNFLPTSGFSITLVTAEHNSDQAYEFDTECLDINDFFSALSIDFGNVPADTTATETIQFTNNSMAPYVVTVDFEGCGAVGLAMVPSAVTVQPGETVDLDFEWTPLNEGQTLNCAGYSCNAGLLFTGISTAAPLIHRLEIVDGGLNPEGINYLDCCQVCQTTFVTFQNTHNSPLTLNDFFITDAGSGVNVSFVGLSGQPPSFPTINPGETIVFEFYVCWDTVTTPLSSWTFQLQTVEHGNELPYTFAMECIDWALALGLSTIPFDFTDTLINTTREEGIVITNITIGDISIHVDYSGCGSPDPIQVTDPTIIPQGTMGVYFLSWTPTSQSDYISCTQNWCGIDFSITGSVVEEPCDCLCCLDIEIQTEGNYLQPQNGFCASDILYSTASFLEKKTVVFKMKYEPGLITGWNIQFNPSLFTFDCTAPFDGTNDFPVKYYIQYLSAQHLDGVAQPMTLLGVTSNAMNLKNWEVNFRPINAVNGTFNIELTFYLIQDYEDFITNLTWNNSQKLKRSTLSESNDFMNLLPSVYNNSSKYFNGAFLVTDPGTIVNDSPFKCLTYTCSNFAARFYNVGLGNGYAEFLNPVFQLTRNNVPVNDFSVFINTKVKFTIDVPAIYGASQPTVIFHLFNTSIEDNSVDFLTSSDSSRFRILTYPGTGVLNNHFVRPAQTGVSTFGWVFSIHVDTNLNPANIYRVAAIVYGSNGDMVNTFLSDEIRVTQFPDMDCDCQPENNSTFLQYWRSHNVDCFQPVGKERIGHIINLTSGDFPECMANAGILMTNWRSQLQSVTLNIYKRKDNFPTNNQTTFFQYETHNSIRNNAFLGGFQNFNELVVSDTGANDVVVYINNRRVRWENIPFSGGQVLVANNNSYMNRTPAGFVGGSYITTNNILDSWIGHDVYFEYVFTFDLRPQVGQPFYWNLVKAYKVNAIDFEPFNSGFEEVITDVVIEGEDFTTNLYLPIEPPFCFSDYQSIRLTYQANREGNFIFFMEKEPFGLPTLVENNEALSPNSMVQLDNPAVISMDTSFDPVTLKASVVLNPQLLENANYRFCGYISFPDAAAVCEYFLLHLDNSGSTQISMLPVTTGDTFQLTFNNATLNRYRWGSTQAGETPFPVVGQTYVLEYSFTVPTTRIMQMWFGQWGYSGVPQVTLPIGSTSGSVSFVWGAATSGEWTIRVTSGTDMTTIGSFKIGTDLCP